MKFLQLTTLYPDMLKDLFLNYTDYNSIKYLDVTKKIKDSFVESQRWHYYLSEKNFQSENFIVNDYFSQSIWCKTNGINIKSRKDWYFEIISHQINFYKPDILFLSSESLLNESQINLIKSNFS